MSTDEPVAASPNANENWITLEENQRFSQSVLWKLMKTYYNDMGPKAWLTGEVPHYATCNTYIAQCYAEVVIAYLRELERTGQLVRSEPVWVLELGAGVGAFASYFLRKFGEVHQESSLRDVEVRYVMTDFTPTNLNAVAEHPHLRVFAANGLLGFGKFDVDTDDAVELRNGTSLGANSCKNPVVVLGNYVFDTFRQDIFRAQSGKLHEVQVSSRAPAGSFGLAEVRTQYNNHPIDEAQYYEDPICNQILADYRALLVDTTFTMPHQGLQAMMRLLALSGGRGLLLTSDKGFGHVDELFQKEQQSMQLHGSFSMMVNFHALGKYFVQRGGVYATTSRRVMSLKTAMCILGGNEADFVDTVSTFRRRVDEMGPGEFFDYLQRERGVEKTIEQVLTLMKLSGYDPGVLNHYAGTIRDNCRTIPEWLTVELRLAIDRTWNNYYLSSQNLPFELGRIFLAMARPMEAARFFQIAIEFFGEMPAAYLNMGISYYTAENPQQALKCFERAKDLDPESGHPREWIARILAERERASSISRPTRIATERTGPSPAAVPQPSSAAEPSADVPVSTDTASSS